MNNEDVNMVSKELQKVKESQKDIDPDGGMTEISKDRLCYIVEYEVKTVEG